MLPVPLVGHAQGGVGMVGEVRHVQIRMPRETLPVYEAADKASTMKVR
jgi:hypothetical protein